MSTSDRPASPTAPRPSREEIEALCILYALSAAPGAFGPIAERLGFDARLAPVVRRAVEALAARGLVVVEGDLASRTTEGARWMAERLGAFGVA